MPIRFSKAKFPDILRHFDDFHYSHFYFCTKSSYFIDNREESYKSAEYMPTGRFYNKFKKFCEKNSIYYNQDEFKKIQKNELISLSFEIIVLSTAGLYIYELSQVSSMSSYASKKQAWLAPKHTYQIMFFLPIEYLTYLKIKSKGERRFKENVFNH